MEIFVPSILKAHSKIETDPVGLSIILGLRGRFNDPYRNIHIFPFSADWKVTFPDDQLFVVSCPIALFLSTYDDCRCQIIHK